MLNIRNIFLCTILFTTIYFTQLSFTESGQSFGDLDAFVENKIWLNDGIGSFTISTVDFGTDNIVAIVDLNNDGKLDVNVENKIFFKRNIEN